MQFAPGTRSLKCPYCGALNEIAESRERVEEQDFNTAFADCCREEDLHEQITVKCTTCGAETTLAPNVTAGRCPFCGFHYAVPLSELAEVVANVEKLAQTFTHALRRLIEMHPGFVLDVDATLRLVVPLAADVTAQQPHLETALAPRPAVSAARDV